MIPKKEASLGGDASKENKIVTESPVQSEVMDGLTTRSMRVVGSKGMTTARKMPEGRWRKPNRRLLIPESKRNLQPTQQDERVIIALTSILTLILAVAVSHPRLRTSRLLERKIILETFFSFGCCLETGLTPQQLSIAIPQLLGWIERVSHTSEHTNGCRIARMDIRLNSFVDAWKKKKK